MQGTEYELWVKEIHGLIHRYEGVENIDIRHNVKLVGAGGVTHQIDIYWEFKQAGTVYRTAVECKGYKNPVSMEKISAFHSVLEDLGGVGGNFVAKNGFQSGAIELAKQYGINPVEIRHPTDEDWGDRMRDLYIECNFTYATNLNLDVEVDGNWAKENGGRFGAFETLATKGVPRGGFPWDNVFVSSNIKIVNAQPIYEPWMNDHAIFIADIEIIR